MQYFPLLGFSFVTAQLTRAFSDDATNFQPAGTLPRVPSSKPNSGAPVAKTVIGDITNSSQNNVELFNNILSM
jgi:hypothetical protein